jgi:hypothetical protein
MKIDVIFQGFPGRTERGYMGWSSVVFIETQDAKILFDTGGTGERSVLLPAPCSTPYSTGGHRLCRPQSFSL